MCGIAGFLGDFDNSNYQLNNMLMSLVHRGPDDQQAMHDGPYSGGMRRLSINDLKGGAQPLYNSSNTVTVFYNGEIYNYKSLRGLLEEKGIVFRGGSDGEVIPHLYDLFGEEVFRYLDGMFAISIWDSKRQKLLLARDLPGEKPLYYSDTPNGLVYASEVKAIKSLSNIELSLDRQSIWDFPSFLWIPEPNTAYENIKSLERGHYLVASVTGIQSIRSFKPENFLEDIVFSSEDEAIQMTREIVERSIKSRLLSDVPVGSFLSGGLDSSIVASVAAKELDHLDTFTIEFENIDDPYHGKANESEAALETSKFIGSTHHNVPVTAQDFKDSLDEFVFYGDLPFSVSSGLGIMAISKVARERGIKVLLTGDGADECFGGYSWYEDIFKNDNEKNHNYPHHDPVTFQNIGMTRKDRINALNLMKPSTRAYAWHYYAHEDEKKCLIHPEFQNNLMSSTRHFSYLDKKGMDNPLEYIKHDRNFYFPNEMLRKVDRMGMANSVEGRTPFASPEVISLANSLTENLMFKDGQLKWVLRKAFEDILSPEVLNRRKHGFNVPIDHWLKNDWFDLVEEAFDTDSELSKNNIIHPKSMDFAIKLLNNESRLSGHTIFSFIMLNKWLRS